MGHGFPALRFCQSCSSLEISKEGNSGFQGLWKFERTTPSFRDELLKEVHGEPGPSNGHRNMRLA